MTVAAFVAVIAIGVVARTVWVRAKRWFAPEPAPPPFDGTLRCATPGCYAPLGHTSNPRTVAWCETCRPLAEPISDPAG